MTDCLWSIDVRNIRMSDDWPLINFSSRCWSALQISCQLHVPSIVIVDFFLMDISTDNCCQVGCSVLADDYDRSINEAIKFTKWVYIVVYINPESILLWSSFQDITFVHILVSLCYKVLLAMVQEATVITWGISSARYERHLWQIQWCKLAFGHVLRSPIKHQR